jgi:hypothetical protein
MSRRRVLIAAILLALPVISFFFLSHIPRADRAFSPVPPDKSCAIAIVDDTDYFQFDSVGPLYDLLNDLGVRVTKTVWAFDAEGRNPKNHGLSLDDPAYRQWAIDLTDHGHEIVLHSATSGHDERATTQQAYALLNELIPQAPRVEVFHSSNKEALYWGHKRLPRPVLSSLYRLARDSRFEGDEEESPYFWLDLSRELVPYVRGFTFNHVNTLSVNPSMPYEDSRTPGAPLWFSSSNGRSVVEFLELLTPANIERLKEETGACIVYTHFSSDFVDESGSSAPRVKSEVRELFTRLAGDPTIEFVPAGELLDRLRVMQFIESSLNSGSDVLRIPYALLDSLGDISVDPSRVPGDQDATVAAGREPRHASTRRIALEAWLAGSELEVQGTQGTRLDGARAISWRERWRLVLRWLRTQAVSPT